MSNNCWGENWGDFFCFCSLMESTAENHLRHVRMATQGMSEEEILKNFRVKQYAISEFEVNGKKAYMLVFDTFECYETYQKFGNSIYVFGDFDTMGECGKEGTEELVISFLENPYDYHCFSNQSKKQIEFVFLPFEIFF